MISEEYFINEHFVFEPRSGRFFSFEEVIFLFIEGRLTMTSFRIQDNMARIYKIVDPPSITKGEKSLEEHLEHINDEINSFLGRAEGDFLQEDDKKHNFELFLKIFDEKEYPTSLKPEKFVEIYLKLN